MNNEARDYYTLSEMADELGISVKTLQNRLSIKRKHPPVFSPCAGVYQFPKKDYLRWREARTVKAIA